MDFIIDDRHESRLSRPIANVVFVLRHQVAVIRHGYRPSGGKLEYFRLSLQMGHFLEVVRLVKFTLNCEMFSTLADVESMENAIAIGDHLEAMVQCCIILFFWELERSAAGLTIPDPNIVSPAWLFDSCNNLRDIAFLRSRLRFFDVNASLVQISIDRSLMRAVRNHSDEDPPESKWQGLLLVFREAGPFSNHTLFTNLDEALREDNLEMPKAAATLFLSYTADVMMTLNLMPRRPTRKASMSRRIILRLLELGASPLVCREHHHVLFRTLEPQLRTHRGSWWLNEDYPRRHPKATALNRMFLQPWDLDFVLEVLERTCCSLDAFETVKRRHGSIELPRLACLAARKLPATALNDLGRGLKFFAMKHRSRILHPGYE